MRTVELKPPTEKEVLILVSKVEGLAKQLRLESTRGTLKTYPGSVHWHFRPTGKKGTLELTWWPVKRRFWIKVASNREAGWMDEAIQSFEAEFGHAP